jgi:carbon starvation protein
LKIGTIILLVVGVLIANPTLQAPTVNEYFRDGGPTFPAGGIFPFVFICIMCGAISGFHALVSSGTTPKMVDKESQVRMIGYGSMLIEGLVGIVALIAAASLDPRLYYPINTDRTKMAVYREKLDSLYKEYEALDKQHPLRAGQVAHKRDLAEVEKMVGNESLRGRTGGAVTLAVGMSLIFTDALSWLNENVEDIMKYWYHFAIMFEALFILTTIDTGTRIARFLLQETLGKVHPKFEKTDWIPGAVLATAIVTAGWGLLVYTGSIDTIWPMFGIANQLLAVVALALVTTMLVNSGRGRYAPLLIVPMLFVITTTMTAGAIMVGQFITMMETQPLRGALNLSLTLFVMTSVGALLVMAAARWFAVWGGMIPVKPEQPTTGA